MCDGVGGGDFHGMLLFMLRCVSSKALVGGSGGGVARVVKIIAL